MVVVGLECKFDRVTSQVGYVVNRPSPLPPRVCGGRKLEFALGIKLRHSDVECGPPNP